jgi:uncharacterized protein YbcI
MADDSTQLSTDMAAVSRAMVALHKEQFGRGPTHARSGFTGRDHLVSVLYDVLLPAELKLVALGESQRVRETRIAFQVATKDEFIAAVEQIVYRKVRAFSSAVDPEANVVWENFVFEPRGAEETSDDDDYEAGEPTNGNARSSPVTSKMR